MGRSKARASGASSKASKAVASTSEASAKNVTYSASELLAKAESILAERSDFELAYKLAEQASAGIEDAQKARLLEVMGTCSLEAGDEDRAAEFFKLCAAESSLAHLYLAQLAGSPEESLQHFKAAVELLMGKIDLTNEPHGKDKLWTSDERENRFQITRALVGMTELYLTDLCFEEDAEARCTEYLELAVRVDCGADMNPEIFSTLASVRLSQQRDQEALEALQKSYTIYRDALLADPDAQHPAASLIPTFETRLNVVRLFIECESYEEALEILESCEAEDDEDLDVLYLLGIVNWSIGEGLTTENEKRDAYIDAREACDSYLKVTQKNPEETDPEMKEQVEDLIKRLESEQKITMKDVNDQTSAGLEVDGEEWEDVSDEDMS